MMLHGATLVLSVVATAVMFTFAAFTVVRRTVSDVTPGAKMGTSYIAGGQEKTSYPSKGVLLPMPMDLIRRGIPVSSIYNSPQRNFSGECSCLNPKSNYTCCGRRIRRSHKMGQILSKHLFDDYEPMIRRRGRPYQEAYDDRMPANDYRDVLLIRNIYDALVSGYLFHKEGQECDDMGYKGELSLKRWYSWISYELDPPREHRSLCKYIASESEEVGMRAYIEWVFRYHYKGIFSHWALAEELAEVRERTLTVCYEAMMSPERDEEAINSILDFWFNGTATHKPYNGSLPGHVDYTGGHATTHDEGLRSHLKDVARTVDEKYYNGEIKWVDSALPC